VVWCGLCVIDRQTNKQTNKQTSILHQLFFDTCVRAGLRFKFFLLYEIIFAKRHKFCIRYFVVGANGTINVDDSLAYAFVDLTPGLSTLNQVSISRACARFVSEYVCTRVHKRRNICAHAHDHEHIHTPPPTPTSTFTQVDKRIDRQIDMRARATPYLCKSCLQNRPSFWRTGRTRAWA